MNTKTTTAKSKTTTKAKTKATPPDATGAKLEALQGSPVTWAQAIKNCVSEYDKNEKLREKLQRQYDSFVNSGRQFFFVDEQRDGVNDPVDSIHPPAAIINKIKLAVEEHKKQDATASEKYTAELEAARRLETSFQRREAEQQIKWDNTGLLKAGEILDDTLKDAGALALSLRAPCYVYADMERGKKNKSRSSEEEKTLFKMAHHLMRAYPPQARRDAHAAKTKEERNKILLDAQIAEGEAIRKKYEEAEAQRRQSIIQKTTGRSPLCIGKIVINWNEKIEHRDEEGKIIPYPFTGKKRWKHIEKLATGQGDYVKMDENFLQSFNKGHAKKFIDALVISEAKEKGIKGNGRYRLII